MEGSRHYILVDKAGRIIDGWSDGPCPARETAGAVLLRGDGGYQFRLDPVGEENPPLIGWESRCHLWRWENGVVRASAAQELAAEQAELAARRPAPSPTAEQRIMAVELAANDQLEANVELDYRLSMLELGLA